ncbi:hypothetical protein EON65_15190 [archaeon]|nr:MAG: hypothetical protein EON65_15190 [archaeon]
MLLRELGKLPLQVHWWRRSLSFWNDLATAPVGSLYRTLLLDNWRDACCFGVKNFSSSVTGALARLGHALLVDSSVLPIISVKAVLGDLERSFHVLPVSPSPRTAPSEGIMVCTYHNWFLPTSGSSAYHTLPMSGSRLRRFLGFRLGNHKLPVALGRRGNVHRDDRACPHCSDGTVGDELHMVFECPKVQGLRHKYCHLFGPPISQALDMRAFFSQRDMFAVVNFTLEALQLVS